jgi:hypothetical protein
MPDRKPLARTREVAAYLDVKPGTMRTWRYLGKGPRFTRDEHGRPLYDWADVDEWRGVRPSGDAGMAA